MRMNSDRRRSGLFAFGVAMLGALMMTQRTQAVEPPPSTYEQPDRVVVMSDILGEYGYFMQMLRTSGVIGANNKWAAGDDHLVILGNIVGYGRGVLPAFEQIRDLEAQAEAAGGKVHLLLGFTEIQLLHNDISVIDPRVYADMTSEHSQRKIDELIDAGAEEVVARFPNAPYPERFEAEWRSLAEREFQPGSVEFLELFAPGTELGDWLRSRNVIIRIGDYLYSHGGLSPEYADKSLDAINNEERAKLANVTLLLQKDIDTQHPSWWKELVTRTEIEMQKTVDAVLAKQQARAMVVGINRENVPARDGLNARVIFANSGIAARQLEAQNARLSSVEIKPDEITLIWDETRIKASMPGPVPTDPKEKAAAPVR